MFGQIANMFGQMITMLNQAIGSVCYYASLLATDYLMLFMIGIFGLALVAKLLIYYIVWAQNKFSKEFEKRVHNYLDGEYQDIKKSNFHNLASILLNKTYEEIYEFRKKFMRRKLDYTASLTDRFFMVEEGSDRLISDTLKETKYYMNDRKPEFLDIAKYAFSINPYFTKIFGKLSIKLLNNLLGILPGLFIIGGIFGTFLGIVKGLPDLKMMDMSNLAQANLILGNFLDRMAFSMNTSLVGIFFSVCFTIINSAFAPQGLFMESVEKISHCLEFLWKDTNSEKLAEETEDKDVA